MTSHKCAVQPATAEGHDSSPVCSPDSPLSGPLSGLMPHKTHSGIQVGKGDVKVTPKLSQASRAGAEDTEHAAGRSGVSRTDAHMPTTAKGLGSTGAGSVTSQAPPRQPTTSLWLTHKRAPMCVPSHQHLMHKQAHSSTRNLLHQPLPIEQAFFADAMCGTFSPSFCSSVRREFYSASHWQCIPRRSQLAPPAATLPNPSPCGIA